MEYDEANKLAIFKFISGSHAYGTNTEESDLDIRGVFIAPLNYAFNIFTSSYNDNSHAKGKILSAIQSLNEQNIDQAKASLYEVLDPTIGDLSFGVASVSKKGQDEELNELRKFLKLAAECNPNIIEFLFIEKGIITQTKEWEKIKEYKNEFLSKRAIKSFGGYAISQLRKIQSHRDYLLNPPKEKPTRQEFGLTNQSEIPHEYRSSILSVKLDFFADRIKEIARKEAQFETAMQKYKSWEKWNQERNPKRKELEKICGYDSKHASHLIRLLRMAREIASSGQVIVHRPDAKELLEIRQGKWNYEKLMEEVTKLETEIKELEQISNLPKIANHKKIAEIYKEIISKVYKINV